MLEQVGKLVEVLLQVRILYQAHPRPCGDGKVEERTGEEQRGRVGGGEKAPIEWDDRMQAFEHFDAQRASVQCAMTEPKNREPSAFR